MVEAGWVPPSISATSPHAASITALSSGASPSPLVSQQQTSVLTASKAAATTLAETVRPGARSATSLYFLSSSNDVTTLNATDVSAAASAADVSTADTIIPASGGGGRGDPGDAARELLALFKSGGCHPLKNWLMFPILLPATILSIFGAIHNIR